MKSVIGLSVFFIFINVSFGQTKRDIKKLNKIFSDYSFLYKPNYPISIRKSKEIIVPDIYSGYTLFTIKWKDIEFVQIYDTGGARLRINILGKGMVYEPCDSIEKCTTQYFSRFYKSKSSINNVFIELERKSENEKTNITEKTKHKLRRAIAKMNIKHLIESEEISKDSLPPIITSSKQNFPETNITLYLSNHFGETTISSKEIQLTTELVPVISTYEIVSFVCYISGAGFSENPGNVFNNGKNFNKDLIKLLRYVRPGTLVVFDEIKVQNGLGKILNARPLIIHAK